MGKELDELSKALASGVSRRAAVRRFVFGSLGAVATSLLPGRTSLAQTVANLNSQCVQLCQGLTGAEFGKCVSDCATHFNMV
jgi:hypothetical protein